MHVYMYVYFRSRVHCGPFYDATTAKVVDGLVLCVAGQIIPRTKRNTTAVRVKETCHFSCRSFPRLHFFEVHHKTEPTITSVVTITADVFVTTFIFSYGIASRFVSEWQISKDMAVPSRIDAKMFFQEDLSVKGREENLRFT